VRRLLLLAARAGALDGVAGAAPKPAAGRIADAIPLAREAAAAGTVLLRNDGTLPLAPERLRRVAVVGPGARDARALGGGSATVPLPHVVTPVAGLARALEGRAEVVGAVGAALSDSLRPARADELAGEEHAAVIRWLDADGAAVEEHGVGTAVLVRLDTDIPDGAVQLELLTRFVPDEPGDWRIGATGFGTVELVLDGSQAAGGTELQRTFDVGEIFSGGPQYAATVPLAAGDGVEVRIRYRWPHGARLFRAGLVVGLPLGPADEELAHAVELARDADVAVVVVGTSDEVESEGFDRTSLALPGRQDELVRAVAAVNPRTVVVVNAGAPVELPWRDDVAAVLVAWFPGMEFGTALADVLLGGVEPGGRLPTTWPTALADAPVPGTTPTDGRLEYAEGLHIGHRAYLRDGVEPAYWFGSGLGYTTWAWESIEAAGPDRAVVRVRNTGDRRGKQVVQVYASRAGSSVERPARWLAGFAVVHADPGERVDVPVVLGHRVLRHWTPDGWAVEPGEFTLSTGPSAGQLHASTSVTVAGLPA
jgi:beta-glucosidase